MFTQAEMEEFGKHVADARERRLRAADAQQSGGDARANEVAALAPILRGMIEGGSYDDPAELYAADFEAPDGDIFVRRAADLLEEYAALTSPAKVADEYLHLSRELVKALKRLSLAAQTSGGTAGRDDELMAAIQQAADALSLSAVGRAIDASEQAVNPAADLHRLMNDPFAAATAWRKPNAPAKSLNSVTEREAFVAWQIRENGWDHQDFAIADGRYKRVAIQDDWHVWQARAALTSPAKVGGDDATLPGVYTNAEDLIAALNDGSAKVGGDERDAFIDKCIRLLEASRHAARVVGIEHIEAFPYLPEYDEAVEWLKENRGALPDSALEPSERHALDSACADIAAVHLALDLPEEDAGGVDAILEAIEELKRRAALCAKVGGDERTPEDDLNATEGVLDAAMCDMPEGMETNYPTVSAYASAVWQGYRKMLAEARAALSADGGEDKREIPDLPPPPDNVLADMQVTVDRLKMWAKGEAHYAPANGYDDPGVKKATISDVKKSAGYFAKRLEESYFSLRDFLFAMDQIRAAIAANQSGKGGE
ncbi:hypothetical protein [Pandoraea sputorum]|nr:hypothetical protein [Pandoraea sputorum]